MSNRNQMQRVEWFKTVDYEILLFLQRHDIKIKPSSVAPNIDYQTNYVGRRMNKLSRAGFLDRENSAVYCLSEFGHRFVTDDVSEDELPPEPEE